MSIFRAICASSAFCFSELENSLTDFSVEALKINRFGVQPSASGQLYNQIPGSDWDVEEDGEWEKPMIPNPDYYHVLLEAKFTAAELERMLRRTLDKGSFMSALTVNMGHFKSRVPPADGEEDDDATKLETLDPELHVRDHNVDLQPEFLEKMSINLDFRGGGVPIPVEYVPRVGSRDLDARLRLRCRVGIFERFSITYKIHNTKEDCDNYVVKEDDILCDSSSMLNSAQRVNLFGNIGSSFADLGDYNVTVTLSLNFTKDVYESLQ